MPNAPTPNLGLIVPTVGGDVNSWGTELNSNLVVIDGLVQPALPPVVTSNTFLSAGAAVETVVQVQTGTSQIQVTLPSPAGVGCRIYTIVKTDAQVFPGSVLIVGTINGGTNYILQNQYQYLRVVGNGAGYIIIGEGNG